LTSTVRGSSIDSSPSSEIPPTTYGTLGAAIALMVWLYWTGFAILVGAELNEELAKISKEGKLPEKRHPDSITKLDLAA